MPADSLQCFGQVGPLLDLLVDSPLGFSIHGRQALVDSPIDLFGSDIPGLDLDPILQKNIVEEGRPMLISVLLHDRPRMRLKAKLRKSGHLKGGYHPCTMEDRRPVAFALGPPFTFPQAIHFQSNGFTLAPSLRRRYPGTTSPSVTVSEKRDDILLGQALLFDLGPQLLDGQADGREDRDDRDDREDRDGRLEIILGQVDDYLAPGNGSLARNILSSLRFCPPYFSTTTGSIPTSISISVTSRASPARRLNRISISASPRNDRSSILTFTRTSPGSV